MVTIEAIFMVERQEGMKDKSKVIYGVISDINPDDHHYVIREKLIGARVSYKRGELHAWYPWCNDDLKGYYWGVITLEDGGSQVSFHAVKIRWTPPPRKEVKKNAERPRNRIRTKK